MASKNKSTQKKTKSSVTRGKDSLAARAAKWTKGGSKLSRSEVVQVRLDPKLRFIAELAARKQRRTLSSFIEWALEGAVQQVELISGEYKITAYEATVEVWDVEESDRFAKLAFKFPSLLTHDEEVLWKLALECDYLWKGKDNRIYLDAFTLSTKFKFKAFREHWEIFKKVVRGELSKDHLPGKSATTFSKL